MTFVFNAITNLTEDFIGYRSLNETKQREKLRGDFYNAYRRLTMVAAMGIHTVNAVSVLVFAYAPRAWRSAISRKEAETEW